MKQCLFSAFQAHVERMEKEATLSEEIPAKRERKHSSNTSNPDTVDVKNGHSTHEVGNNFFSSANFSRFGHALMYIQDFSEVSIFSIRKKSWVQIQHSMFKNKIIKNG